MLLACAGTGLFDLVAAVRPRAILARRPSSMPHKGAAPADLASVDSDAEDRDAELSAPVVPTPISSPAERADVMPPGLAELLSQEPADPARILEMLLDEAIRS